MENKDLDNLIPLIFTLKRLIRERIAGHGDMVSLMQLKILSLVLEKGTPTMKEVANSLFITLPSATSAIDRLVRDGQLERISDNKDRRIVRLEITKKGRIVYDEGHRDIFQKMNEILVPLDKNEIKGFTDILTKIINSHKK